MHRRAKSLSTLFAFAAPLLAFTVPALSSADAHAGIGACGNIHVEASAECEVVAGVECEGMCTPVSFQAQCAGDLHFECRGECQFELAAECSASCEADCTGQCEVNPGNFDCRGECFGRCEGNCDAACQGSDNMAQCRASCEGSCEGECSASCEGTPPSAECSARCEASCEGSCRAEANMGCQIDCQKPRFPQCEASLEGGCKLDCESDGALFCDSDYVDHGGNLEECVASLRAVLSIEVDGYARGDCAEGRCEGEAGFTCSCTTSDDPQRNNTGWAITALGLFMLSALRRRRDR